MRCIFCLDPIKEGQTFVGAGAGDGHLFVHREECYDRLFAARRLFYEEVTPYKEMRDESNNGGLQ